jgi:hypothetical protein
MPVITYTAVDRGELVGGHTAGTTYQIETQFNAYPRERQVRADVDETLDGTPEGYAHAAHYVYAIESDLILLAQRPNWRELFSSLDAREQFSIDFTGTIAAPGVAVPVWLVDTNVREQQVGGIGVRYAFRVKVHP